MYLLSLTVRHGLGDDLKAVRSGLAAAWRGVQGGEPWARFKARFGFSGSIRALEVTFGANGFHPHLHALVLFKRELTATELREAHDFLSGRWMRAVSRSLPASAVPDAEHGCDLRPSHSAQYISKLGLALEMTAPVGKNGRSGNRSMLQVASDFAETGDVSDLGVWRTYTDAIRGARMLTWTRGLRQAAGLEEDTPDEDLLNAIQPIEETIAVLSASVWKQIRDINGAIAALLDAAEQSGIKGVQIVVARLLHFSERTQRKPKGSGTQECTVASRN